MSRSFIDTIFPTPKYMALIGLGVDISDRAIKYVLLSHDSNPRLLLYGEERIAPGVVTAGMIQDAPALTEALKIVRQKSGIQFAHFSLPEEKAYIVDIEVPNARVEDLRETLALHLDEHVPLDSGAALFDFDIVHWPDDKQPSTEVVLSAIETANAEAYASVVLESGFLPLSFELESQALARALVPEGSIENLMILDIGREQSNLSIVSSGMVSLASSLAVGGDAFTKAISDDLKVSIDEARKMKEDFGLLRQSGDDVFNSIVRVASALRDEIDSRFNYWTTRKGRGGHQENIKKILLSGGNASIPGLASYLSSGVDAPVNVGNPWVNITNFDDYIPEIPAKQALKYGTSLGLALRGHSSII